MALYRKLQRVFLHTVVIYYTASSYQVTIYIPMAWYGQANCRLLYVYLHLLCHIRWPYIADSIIKHMTTPGRCSTAANRYLTIFDKCFPSFSQLHRLLPVVSLCITGYTHDQLNECLYARCPFLIRTQRFDARTTRCRQLPPMLTLMLTLPSNQALPLATFPLLCHACWRNERNAYGQWAWQIPLTQNTVKCKEICLKCIWYIAIHDRYDAPSATSVTCQLQLIAGFYDRI